MSETAIMQRWLLRLSAQGYTLFRNNVGTGWAGKFERLPGGDILIHNPRPLHCGLYRGSSDLIGWRSVEVTQDMVGQRIAMFVGAEVKAQRGRESDAQRNFREILVASGGEGLVLRGNPK
jgi:hypothetical protein